MSRLSNLDSLLFGFRIEDIFDLQELIETVCIIGGFNKLIRFVIDESIVTIDFLDPTCVQQRLQFDRINFRGAKVDGRDRNGKRVSFVREANVLSVKIDLLDGVSLDENGNPIDDIITISIDVDIDDDKIFMISNFIK